jgi:hypothetical protein
MDQIPTYALGPSCVFPILNPSYLIFQIGSSIFGKSAGTASVLHVARTRDVELAHTDHYLAGKPEAVNLELAPGSNLGDGWRSESTFKRNDG